MDRTTPSIADLTTTHAAGWYISAGPDGTEYGRGRTATDALLMAAERLDAPRYDLMLDVCAGDPEELEGPSEEGGEGGPNPDADPYISALAAHVAREYTAFLAAAPDSPAPSFHQPAPAGGGGRVTAGPCDVSGCAAPGSTVWLGRWPAYPARLCGAHRKAVA